MSQTPANELYYDAFRKRTDFSEVPFAEDVVFRGPTGPIEGATALRARLAALAQGTKDVTMRHQVVGGGQVLSFYDFDLGLPGGPIPMAERLGCDGETIEEIELLFDPARLAAPKES